MLRGSSAQGITEPLILGASAMKASLGNGRDKLQLMAVTLKTKAGTAAHAAGAAWKHSTQAVETAVKHGIGTAKGKLGDTRTLGLDEPLFGRNSDQGRQGDHSKLDQVIAMGFSESAAALALEAAHNNVQAAVTLLIDAQSNGNVGKPAKESKRCLKKNKSDKLEAEAASLAQLDWIGRDFELQVGLLRSRHDHALEELTFQNALRESKRLAQLSSEPLSPRESNFLPSVGTWLMPVSLKRMPGVTARESKPSQSSPSIDPACMQSASQVEEPTLCLKELVMRSKAELVDLHNRYNLALDTVCISHMNGQAANTGILEILKATDGYKSQIRASRCGA